jgi:PadR family transcriptional regulator, regulatory protein PadR
MGHESAPDLLPGTLDLLILKALAVGPLHGFGIAQRLRTMSGDVLEVGESSLYPALQRLLLKGWTKAQWGTSENNRRARYYTLTPAGRKQLAVERADFDRLIFAIQRVLNAT